MTSGTYALSVGDLLLRWVSELGSGRLRDLRTSVRRAALGRGVDCAPGAESRWVRDLAALGHLDVDWHRDRWSVAPSVLTRLPYSDGLAVVVGRRTASFDRGLTDAESWATLIRVANPAMSGEIPVPDTVVLRYEDPAWLPDDARRLGCAFTPCAALQLAGLLQEVEEGPLAAPPASDNAFTVQRFSLADGRYEPTALYSADGLYRWRSADWSRLTQVRRGGAWRTVEHEVGVYLELADRISVLRWAAEPGAGRSLIGCLTHDRAAPLPPLHARAAVLCSGLRPRVDGTARTVSYDNVPLPVGERIATSLRQRLSEVSRRDPG
ncbi:hypothetical protein [Pseudofrankia sp. DC12]|uniref:hypothetical protein n=1 Tax=Pseudofrankia sp. DC12 TaxID=683315 RepID=UPI0005F7EF79|nr:hypothetical protein [Pseudofrankia sp. DC12]